MKKKIISMILLITLSLQVLPVWQIGFLLYDNVMNEELPDSDCGSLKSPEPKFSQGNMDITEYHSLFFPLNKLISFESYFSHIAEIPNNHTGDIFTPPPNEYLLSV